MGMRRDTEREEVAMLRLAISLFTAAFLPLLEFGCAADAVFAVRQPVRLCVTDAAHGQPIVGAEIQFGPRPKAGTDERTWFAQHGQTTVTTDDAGWATAPVEYSWIVGGLISQKVAVTQPDGSTKWEWHARGLLTPFTGDTDTHRDRVTGETYWCRVEHAAQMEVIPIRLKRGAVVAGCLFSVQIESVGQPEPIRW
jgi:hypothetical protein